MKLPVVVTSTMTNEFTSGLERTSVFQIFDNNRALSENRESRGSVKSGTSIKVSDIGCKRRPETGN